MTKYVNKVREQFNNYNYPVFTLSDIRVLLNIMHISSRYLKILINQLIKNKEIKHITRGVYTFHDDIAVVGFAFRPFYYGLEDALTYWNLWTQATNPIVMTTNGVREGIRKFEDANYSVNRIDPKLFFGFNFIKHYDMWIPVSDLEKTMLDLLYYKCDLRKDVMEKLLNLIDRNKLEMYLKFYNPRFKRFVLSHNHF